MLPYGLTRSQRVKPCMWHLSTKNDSFSQIPWYHRVKDMCSLVTTSLIGHSLRVLVSEVRSWLALVIRDQLMITFRVLCCLSVCLHVQRTCAWQPHGYKMAGNCCDHSARGLHSNHCQSVVKFCMTLAAILDDVTGPKKYHRTGLILGLRPANERCRYFVTPSLIGWAQT